jgi:DNA-binding helix-hairpin-helix protein with protein kinase domain
LISVVDDKSVPVPLGAEIAKGGEGTVYEVASDPSVVAKIYANLPNGSKVEKLSAMARLATPEVLKFAAWPSSTLRRNGVVVGLLMRRVPSSSKPIHELYTPKSRLRDYPSANWQFLVNVAANVTRGFAVIHQSGHVIGDVNHGNILIDNQGLAVFIDCDSFQIQSSGKVYLCEVGVSTYTPPELQNKAFNQVARTQNHDSFGLAVLLFHLLFMGRHPFAGRYSGPGYMPIERAIAECRFAFGRLAPQMQMNPPPDTLLLSQVSTGLADAFERAFGYEAARGTSRPTPREWLSLLEGFQRELTRCKTNRTHVYYGRLTECPWCRLEGHGICLFIDVGIAITPGLNIDVLWTKLTSLPALGTPPPLPTLASLKVTVAPAPEALSLGRKRKVRIGSGIVTVVVALCICVGFKISAIPFLVVIAVATGFAFKFPRELERQHALLVSSVHEHQKQFQALQTRYMSDGSDAPFVAKVNDLKVTRAEYTQLPLLRQKKFQEMEKSKFQLQLLRPHRLARRENTIDRPRTQSDACILRY